MFKQFYNMSFNLFDKGLKEKDVYISSDLREMNSRLEFLNSTRGIGVFTAPAGIGKTFELRCFTRNLNPNLTKVIYLCFSTVTTVEFYRQVCISLGIKPCCKKSDMFRNIKEYMESMSSDKRVHFILVWDEALKQRIVINYDFNGLTENEGKEYIHSRLLLAGTTTAIIADNAVIAAYGSSSGSIRRLNAIMTKALLIGSQNEKAVIDTELIMAATNEISCRFVSINLMF